MRLQRPRAFAGLLIVGLIALIGFAAFSATGARRAGPIDLPADANGRVAGAILGVDLGPDAALPSAASDGDPASENADGGSAATSESAPDDANPSPAPSNSGSP